MQSVYFHAVTEDCSLGFTFGFNPNKNQYLDMDLSLYKAKEDDSSTYYLVFIIYIVSPTNGYIMSSRNIDADCDGWQVFHLHDYVSSTLQNGTNFLQFRVLVFKDGQFGMPCSEISNIFRMNAVQEEVQEEDEGSALDDKTTATTTEETVDGITEYVETLDNQLDYIPVMTIFTAKKERKKRDTSVRRLVTADKAAKNRCRRVDKFATQDSIWISNELYSVLHPVTYNVGECKYESEEGDAGVVSKQHCVPTKFKSVEMLVKKTTQSRHYVIHRNNDTIIDECGLSFHR